MAKSLADLTTKELLELRLKCTEPFVMTASKYDLQKDVIFDLGEKMWNHVTKGLTDTVEKPAVDTRQVRPTKEK